MADSKTDPCERFRGRILDLACGESDLESDPALAVHMASCEVCRRRHEFDAADHGRRQAHFRSMAFPAGQGDRFLSELNVRVSEEKSRGLRTLVRVAASIALVAGGIWLGIFVGGRFRGGSAVSSDPGPNANLKVQASSRSSTGGHGELLEVSDGPSVPMRFAWPELQLVSDTERGF